MAILKHGFQELQRRQINEIESEARLYRHGKTGARLLSLINKDENKVFGISFRTPPTDSTGVAHILEHSVLCGSRKFPVKDPFIRLAQGSLNTFLNAMTFPDKTTYPVASQNLQDFYNLIDVYIDTVLHPKLTRETFEQEGWHYYLDASNSRLTYKGIVYNEMKGAYSSPNSVMYKLVQEAMFPNTTYGVDSGGDPKVITDLTYEALIDFHSKYYHPSNSWIYYYGDDNPEERLRLMNEQLSEFSELNVHSDVSLQTFFTKPIRVEGTYPAGKETEKAKSNISISWLLDEITDSFLLLALNVLDEALMGTPASPLRRALTDSGYGEDPFGSIDFELRQATAIYGLRGINIDDCERVEALILQTLRIIAEQGFDKDTLDAAINSVEFSLRENNTGRFPRGLSIMLCSLSSWLYDRDPLERITFEEPLEKFKNRIWSSEHILENLIKDKFLRNPHRVTAVVKPDSHKSERQASEERGRLDKIHSNLSQKKLKRLINRAHELKQLQDAPDLPEDIAKIPHLKLTDLPSNNINIPSTLSLFDGVDVLTHALPTNGIIYLDLTFDLRHLSIRQLSLLNIFGRALLETGSVSLDFISFTQRISRDTGGIYTIPYVTTTCNGTESYAAHLLIRSKVISTKAPELASIIIDALNNSIIDNRERIKQIVLEEKAAAEANLVPNAHIIAARRVNAGF
ncbi:MAG: insulinase family protein, partial [Hyphomicrobiaceae bacterium]|nr:insulinase family protein [Hyphomicrobiaceae bacterium]